MKKVVLSLALVATMAFVSCKETEKPAEEAAVEATEVEATQAVENAEVNAEATVDSTKVAEEAKVEAAKTETAAPAKQ